MITNEELLNQFVEEFRYRLQKNTLVNYRQFIYSFLEFCGKHVKNVTAKDIRGWIDYLDEQNQKNSTIRSKLVGLRTFLVYCLEETYIDINPISQVEFPKLPDFLPFYLTQEQLVQLRSKTSHKKRERALIETLYATGVRVGELLSIQKTDVNWDERIILIRKGKGKKDRLVLFTNECKERLQAYLAEHDKDQPYLFLNVYGKPITIRGVQHLFDTFSEQLGVKMTPHTMRHTFAAHLAQKGMPLSCIQILLGHDRIQDTQRYARLYHHARKQQYDYFL